MKQKKQKAGRKGRKIESKLDRMQFTQKTSTNCCFFPTDQRNDSILPDQNISNSIRTRQIMENIDRKTQRQVLSNSPSFLSQTIQGSQFTNNQNDGYMPSFLPQYQTSNMNSGSPDQEMIETSDDRKFSVPNILTSDISRSNFNTFSGQRTMNATSTRQLEGMNSSSRFLTRENENTGRLLLHQ